MTDNAAPFQLTQAAVDSYKDMVLHLTSRPSRLRDHGPECSGPDVRPWLQELHDKVDKRRHPQLRGRYMRVIYAMNDLRIRTRAQLAAAIADGRMAKVPNIGASTINFATWLFELESTP